MVKYCRLAQAERYQIEVLLKRGDSIRTISRTLERSASTISRELKRNTQSTRYHGSPAHKRALKLRRCLRPAFHKINPGSQTAIYIEAKMGVDWSPEQIAGRMKREKFKPKVSYSTIYRFIYRESALREATLWKRLRRPRRCRKKLILLKDRPNLGIIPNRVFIKDRPKFIDKRQRKGDYERDTILGGDTGPVLLSIVDRVSKFTHLALLPKKGSKFAHEMTVELLKDDPHLNSITNDNGREFSHHERTSQVLECPIYFSRPHHPWERGTNENMNGLIRQYFPRKSNFHLITPERVKEAERLLNNRPRKCLGYRTPMEIHHGASRS